jgi:DNA adenine methylase
MASLPGHKSARRPTPALTMRAAFQGPWPASHFLKLPAGARLTPSALLAILGAMTNPTFSADNSKAGDAGHGAVMDPIASHNDGGSQKACTSTIGECAGTTVTRGEVVPKTYPGGKGGSGVYHTIINLMPPHRVYIEPFLGSARVMKAKLPADRNIGLDLDGDMIAQAHLELASAELASGDGVAFLERFKWAGGELVYCDPPYLMETRASKRPIYKFEVTHHERLLKAIKSLPCYVMISGYWSSLYAAELASWRHVSFQAMTRGGKPATEFVWCNFPEPTELHDYRYLGRDFRERERIKRKKARWSKRLSSMPALERHALFAAIREVYDR